MQLLPLDRRGLRSARLLPLWRTSPKYLARRLAYSLRAPSLSAARTMQALDPPPSPSEVSDTLFIVGYWRSGTTLLHEHLALDHRRATPNTHQCFNPQTFGLLRPGHKVSSRPMDSMAVSATSPQEDEFAIAGLGGSSPYALWLTPSRMVEDWRHGLDFEPGPATSAWLQAFVPFAVAVKRGAGKPLQLKSPPHAFRIEMLAKALPDSKFLYVLRDPKEVFFSTTKMLHEMCTIYALEDWSEDWLREYVINTRIRLAQSVRTADSALGQKRFAMIHFEDLAANPLEAIGSALEQLGHERTSGFESRLLAESGVRRNHQRAFVASRVTLPDEVQRRWAEILDVWQSGAVT